MVVSRIFEDLFLDYNLTNLCNTGFTNEVSEFESR
jgi:hypothetical protein